MHGKTIKGQLRPVILKALFYETNGKESASKDFFHSSNKYDKIVRMSIGDVTLLLGEYFSFLGNALMENRGFKHS